MKKRVVVAMSGGVDSSVAAALLKQQGYEVIGICMKLWEQTNGEGRCCSIEDIHDARRVASQLNIPFYVINFQEEFQQLVVSYFTEEYLRGRTPNPCIPCNKEIKFRLLLDKAQKLDACFIATGHYAIIENDDGRYRLFRGIDRGKDQSYFLFNLTQEQLSHILLPLGHFKKAEIRKMAEQMKLKVAMKKESQEICFISAGNYQTFIEKRVPAERIRKGEIVDVKGRVLGHHRGLHAYTIGQRRGLGISAPNPLYVIGFNVDKARLIVGEEKDLFSRGLIAENVHWIHGRDFSENIYVKIRYRHPEVKATIFEEGDDSVRVEFSSPQRAVTPGQAVVFFRENEVLGGGWIKKAMP